MAPLRRKNVPNTPEKRAFAIVLAELRRRRGLTQEQLGFESGYHPKYMSLLERAQFSPSLTTILELATALGVSGAEIVRRVEKILPKDRSRRREARLVG
jgi:transcriptional regulator with XRE-family HTH domain